MVRCIFCNEVEKLCKGKVSGGVVGESRVCSSCSKQLADIIVDMVLDRLNKSKKSGVLEDDFDE